MEGENISPPASTAANVGHGEPTKDVLNTHYILERQVNRKAKLWPFKSVLGAQPTWQAQGYKCLCRNTRENQQKVEMPLLLVADGCRQQLTRGFAVHDSFFAISGAANLTHLSPSLPPWREMETPSVCSGTCCAPALAATYRFGKWAFSEAQGKSWLPDIHLGEKGLCLSGEYNNSLISFLLI